MENLGLGYDDSLSLDSIYNNYHSDEIIAGKWCPNAMFYARVVGENSKGRYDKKVLLGCHNWSCPVCSKHNAYKLKKKTINAFKAHIHGCDTKGFRLGYFVKFLTLTVPGKDYRAFTTPEDAEVQLKKAFNKLMRALKKTLGGFEYLWVMEAQKDGYPHLHVVMIGKAIAPRSVLEHVKVLWERKYGMGFAWIKKTNGSVEGLASYITKYMTKELGSGKKGNRVYSMSRELRRVFKVEDFVVAVVEFGRVKFGMDGEIFFEEVWNKYESQGYGLDHVPRWVYEDLEEDYQLKLPF